MQPVERLINLVALLLNTPRPLTFEDIRERMPEAYAQEDVNSAKRMFERDKDLLRDHGIPLKVEPTDAWEAEDGYIILPDEYYLPEITFTPEEISALFVAAHTPAEDSAAEEGVRKLLYGADGGILTGLVGGPLATGPDVSGSRLSGVADAIAGQERIRFEYRTARGVVSERHVDPYGLVWRGGHWYVVGTDIDQSEIRSFRLSRFSSDAVAAGEAGRPPEGFRATEHVQAGPWGLGPPATVARVAFSPEVAWWAMSGVPDAEVVRTREDGWVETSFPTTSEEALASWILGLGQDAEVLDPQSLRDELVAQLEDVVAEL